MAIFILEPHLTLIVYYVIVCGRGHAVPLCYTDILFFMIAHKHACFFTPMRAFPNA